MAEAHEITPHMIDLRHGDCLEVLKTLDSASVDAVITDPPYSSGGFTRSDRTADPSAKYCQNGVTLGRSSFSGDNRDQRGFAYWCALWLSECQRILKPGGYALMFTDWRQLPVSTDALQSGGFIWRGIIAWDKGRGARAPHKGYFRHQCEYVVWGTNGPLEAATHDGPYDGCIHQPTIQADKFHMTGKPTVVMQELVRIVPVGGVVVDPFMGSGTTGVACVNTGRSFIGIEREQLYYDIASRRIAEAQEKKTSPLFAATADSPHG